MTFECTYAGQPVCLDHQGQLAELFETRWPDPSELFRVPSKGEQSSPFTAGGTVNRFHMPYPELPRISLNEMQYPSGYCRFSRAMFVVDNVRLKAILSACYGYTSDETPELKTLPASWGSTNTVQTLKFVQDGVTVSYPMFLLPPVRLDASGSNTLWIIPLVDRRYYWNLQAIELLDLGDTFSTAVQELADHGYQSTGTTLADPYPPTPDAYGTFDAETFADQTIPLGVALEAIALSTGRRWLLRPESSNTVLTANLALPGVRLGGLNPTILRPEALWITCRKTNDYYPEPNGEHSLLAATPADDGTISPDRPGIRSTWYVQHYGGTVDAASEAAAQAMADKLAADLELWGNKQYVASFAGVANWSMSGHDDYLSIRIVDEAGGAAAITRVVSLPSDFRPRVNLCQRPDIYVHPHETGTGTLYEILGPGGTPELTFAKATSLYDGSTTKRIRVKSSPANPNLEKDSGETVFMHYQEGTGWCVVGTADDSEESTLVMFTLLGPLTIGTAEATVSVVFPTKDADAPAVGSTITVTDPGGFFKYGIATSKGFAWKSGETYRVIQCNQLALQVDAQLLEQAEGGGSGAGYDLPFTGTATVLQESLRELTPPPFGMLPGPANIDVNAVPNPLQLCGMAGDRVILQFDGIRGDYFVLAVQKWATRIVGSAIFSAAGNITLDVTDPVGIDGPVRDEFGTILAQNTHGFQGVGNKKVRCELLPNGSWEVYQVDKTYIEQRVVEEVYKTDTALRERATTITMEGQKTTPETVDIIGLTASCPEGANVPVDGGA